MTSPIAGTVKSIASEGQGNDSAEDDGYGYGDSGDSSSSNAYIVLTKSDSFEVKGTINEMSASALQEGMQLLIRSRTDASQTWTGTLDRIDWEKADTSSNSSMYYSSSDSDSMTNSSKYPFYVTLDSQDGLILGQHVYIETNVDGSTEDSGAHFSLPSYYIVDLDTDSPYVWAEGSNGKLEKRKVELGDYDEDMDQYPVISGLALTDYIAFPSEECAAGVKAEHYDQYSGDGEDMPADEGGEYYDEGAMDEGMDTYDEGAMDEGMDTYDEGAMDEGIDTFDAGAMDGEMDSYEEDGMDGGETEPEGLEDEAEQ